MLIDSSYYIDALRQSARPLRFLDYLALHRNLVVCGMVRAEVGRGIKNPITRNRFHAVWDAMINVATDNRLWDSVEQAAWDLDRHGITLPIQDIIIACCAREVDAVVLTHDKRFFSIPRCKVALKPEDLL